MQILDVFKSDAFGTLALTEAVNVLPNKYGRLQELNLMPGKGVNQPDIAIENYNGVLNLLPSRKRGEAGSKGTSGKRSLLTFRVPHFPHEDTLLAAELDGVRAFGTGDRLQTVQDKVNEKLETMRNKHDITLEWLRMGALKGEILDADATVIYNLFTEFGITEKSVSFSFGDASNVEASSREIIRHIEDNLLGDTMTGVHCLASPEFFDALTADATVREAYKYYQSVQNPLREDPRNRFVHQGIVYEEYRGQAPVLNADGTTTVRRFIAAGQAHFFPMGTTTSFRTFFAPADFVETVNTQGAELYAKQKPMDFDRGVDMHTQANPLPICMRPGVLVCGTIA